MSNTTTFHQLLQNDAVPLTLEAVRFYSTPGNTANAFNHFLYWTRRISFVGMNLDAEGRIVSYVYEDTGRRAQRSEGSLSGVVLLPREGLVEALETIAANFPNARRRNRLTTIYLYLLLNILRQKRYKVYSCSQVTLAAELGTTQPHLSCYLNQLISCGLINYSRHSYSISEGVSRSYKLPLAWYGKLKADYNWF